MAERHIVLTEHIQHLITNALLLTETANGETAGHRVQLSPQIYESYAAETDPLVEHLLCKAAADLRHAADELDVERLACYGWKQK